MTSTSADALEWEQVLSLVRRYIATAAGGVELTRIQPSEDRARIERELAEAGEGMACLRAGIRVKLNGIPDITTAVQKLRIEGAALEPREIFDLILFLDRSLDARSDLLAAAD